MSDAKYYDVYVKGQFKETAFGTEQGVKDWAWNKYKNVSLRIKASKRNPNY